MTKYLINPKNLEVIAKELIYLDPRIDVKAIFQNYVIPKKILSVSGPAWELITEVFKLLASSKKHHNTLLNILEELLRYLNSQLQESKFKSLEHTLKIILLHDGLMLCGFKIYKENENKLIYLNEENNPAKKELEFYLKKKILTEDLFMEDTPYDLCHLSYNNNTLSQILGCLDELIKKDLVALTMDSLEDFITKDGKSCFRWDLIKRLDDNPLQIIKDKDWGTYLISVDICSPESGAGAVPAEELLLKSVSEEITQFMYGTKKLTEEDIKLYKEQYSNEQTANKVVKVVQGQYDPSAFSGNFTFNAEPGVIAHESFTNIFNNIEMKDHDFSPGTVFSGEGSIGSVLPPSITEYINKFGNPIPTGWLPMAEPDPTGWSTGGSIPTGNLSGHPDVSGHPFEPVPTGWTPTDTTNLNGTQPISQPVIQPIEQPTYIQPVYSEPTSYTPPLPPPDGHTYSH